MKDNSTKRVDCFKCAHLSITWNPQMPKACKLYGFKSAQLPSAVVFSSTGEPCMGFKEKNTKKP